MTNSSLRSALECAAVLLLLVGCGPKDGIDEFESGKAAYDVRDLAKAGRLFEKSLEYAPTNVDSYVYLARVRLELGDLSEARKAIATATELAAGDSDVRLLGAQIAWHSKDYPAAAKGFTAVAQDQSVEPAIRADAWVGVGIVEMTCNNRHFARIAFMRAIRLDRRNASARYHLAMLYRDAFGWDRLALEQLEIFVRLDVSASPRVQKVQRTVIPALKESIAAADAARPGVSRRNSSACATAIAKAEAAEKKGNWKTARQNYQEALTFDPLSYPAAIGLAKAWQKTDTTKAGMQKAFESFKTACMLSGSTVSTFLSAGSLAVKLGYHAQSVEIYSRAVATSPNSIEAVDGLIAALRRSGNRAKIAAAYESYRAILSGKHR